MNLEGSLRAYAAAKQSIDVIAKAVGVELKTSASAQQPVVVATDVQLQNLNQYRSFLAQVEQLRMAAEDVLDAQPPSLANPCLRTASPPCSRRMWTSRAKMSR